MRGELIALDLETTGLNIHEDAIIEFGAVRIKDGIVTEEFATLIDPGFEIPAEITQITGIETEDVRGKPSIKEVLPQIERFVGDAPVIAHNVAFDMGFLRRYGILKNNLAIDTYDLAAIMLPAAPRYNLTSLTWQMGVELSHAHRALDDARASALVYWRLWQQILALPPDILHSISRFVGAVQWDTGQVFEAALQGHDTPPPLDIYAFFRRPLPEQRPLHPAPSLTPLDSAEAAELIAPGSRLSQILPDYEQRPQQSMMVEAIVDAFNKQQHLLIEAGTGTGKSLAYLLPAARWALANGERVVIATHTINLQEQLLQHDVPAVQAALGQPFSAALIKGRGNYLCPQRLATLYQRGPADLDELRMLAKILVWLHQGSSGDRGDLNLRGPAEITIWQRLSAEDENCTEERCQTAAMGLCPLHRARRAAEAAHVLIANHALLVSDALSEQQVMPPYRYLIVDEAHQFEESLTGGLAFRIDQSTLLRRLADLSSTSGGLPGDLLRLIRQHNLPDKKAARLHSYIQNISEAALIMQKYVKSFFQALQSFLHDLDSASNSGFAPQLRVLPEHRQRASFGQVQLAWQRLESFFAGLEDAMQHLTAALQRLGPEFSEQAYSTEGTAHYLRDVARQLRTFTNDPDPNTIYWINLSYNTSEPILHSAPLHVGPMVEQYVWNARASVVMTSATLQTDHNFSFIRERLYADPVQTLDVGSPFNYAESTLLYIPDDVPEPSEKNSYQRAVERGIIELAAALGGRVMALFTSYAQLKETAQAIAPRLALGDITVYDQSDGSSRTALLEGFTTTEKAVLLGTKSFWQGVDVPGDSLSALVIVRLPFAVPTDPVFAARSETYENSFADYAVPEAVLRFRQGFGRLIRTRSDRGICAIFDRRIISKTYGRSFLESLPDCTVQHGPLANLPGIAKTWLHTEDVS